MPPVIADLKNEFRTAARSMDRESALAALISIADSWEAAIDEDVQDVPLALIMPLSRYYGSGERGLQRLCDWDAARVAAMRRSQRYGFAFLAVECVVEGAPMPLDLRDRRRREREGAEHEDEGFHQMDDVFDREITVIAADQEPSRGRAIDFNSLELDYGSDVVMVDECKVFCCEPDEEVFEGCSLWHTYRRTSVVFWPLAAAHKLPHAEK